MDTIFILKGGDYEGSDVIAVSRSKDTLETLVEQLEKWMASKPKYSSFDADSKEIEALCDEYDAWYQSRPHPNASDFHLQFTIAEHEILP